MDSDPSYFLPSETARLVLGYLEDEGYTATCKTFMKECVHLQEYVALLKRGRQFPLTINGFSLVEMLEKFAQLYLVDINKQKVGLNTIWSQIESLMAILKRQTAYKNLRIEGVSQNSRTRRGNVRKNYEVNEKVNVSTRPSAPSHISDNVVKSPQKVEQNKEPMSNIIPVSVLVSPDNIGSTSTGFTGHRHSGASKMKSQPQSVVINSSSTKLTSKPPAQVKHSTESFQSSQKISLKIDDSMCTTEMSSNNESENIQTDKFLNETPNESKLLENIESNCAECSGNDDDDNDDDGARFQGNMMDCDSQLSPLATPLRNDDVKDCSGEGAKLTVCDRTKENLTVCDRISKENLTETEVRGRENDTVYDNIQMEVQLSTPNSMETEQQRNDTKASDEGIHSDIECVNSTVTDKTSLTTIVINSAVLNQSCSTNIGPVTRSVTESSVQIKMPAIDTESITTEGTELSASNELLPPNVICANHAGTVLTSSSTNMECVTTTVTVSALINESQTSKMDCVTTTDKEEIDQSLPTNSVVHECSDVCSGQSSVDRCVDVTPLTPTKIAPLTDLPLLKTPGKNVREYGFHGQGKSPRRKRPPKRKSQADKIKERKSSATQSNMNDSSNSNEGSLHENSFPTQFIEQLLNNPALHEKLAENINKTINCSDLSKSQNLSEISGIQDTSHKSDETQKPSISLEDILDPHETQMTENQINDIIDMTKGDTVFESLFKLFNQDIGPVVEKTRKDVSPNLFNASHNRTVVTSTNISPVNPLPQNFEPTTSFQPINTVDTNSLLSFPTMSVGHVYEKSIENKYVSENSIDAVLNTFSSTQTRSLNTPTDFSMILTHTLNSDVNTSKSSNTLPTMTISSASNLAIPVDQPSFASQSGSISSQTPGGSSQSDSSQCFTTSSLTLVQENINSVVSTSHLHAQDVIGTPSNVTPSVMDGSSLKTASYMLFVKGVTDNSSTPVGDRISPLTVQLEDNSKTFNGLPPEVKNLYSSFEQSVSDLSHSQEELNDQNKTETKSSKKKEISTKTSKQKSTESVSCIKQTPKSKRSKTENGNKSRRKCSPKESQKASTEISTVTEKTQQSIPDSTVNVEEQLHHTPKSSPDNAKSDKSKHSSSPKSKNGKTASAKGSLSPNSKNRKSVSTKTNGTALNKDSENGTLRKKTKTSSKSPEKKTTPKPLLRCNPLQPRTDNKGTKSTPKSSSSKWSSGLSALIKIASPEKLKKDSPNSRTVLSSEEIQSHTEGNFISSTNSSPLQSIGELTSSFNSKTSLNSNSGAATELTSTNKGVLVSHVQSGTLAVSSSQSQSGSFTVSTSQPQSGTFAVSTSQPQSGTFAVSTSQPQSGTFLCVMSPKSKGMTYISLTDNRQESSKSDNSVSNLAGKENVESRILSHEQPQCSVSSTSQSNNTVQKTTPLLSMPLLDGSTYHNILPALQPKQSQHNIGIDVGTDKGHFLQPHIAKPNLNDTLYSESIDFLESPRKSTNSMNVVSNTVMSENSNNQNSSGTVIYTATPLVDLFGYQKLHVRNLNFDVNDSSSKLTPTQQKPMQQIKLIKPNTRGKVNNRVTSRRIVKKTVLDVLNTDSMSETELAEHQSSLRTTTPINIVETVVIPKIQSKPLATGETIGLPSVLDSKVHTQVLTVHKSVYHPLSDSDSNSSTFSNGITRQNQTNKSMSRMCSPITANIVDDFIPDAAGNIHLNNGKVMSFRRPNSNPQEAQITQLFTPEQIQTKQVHSDTVLQDQTKEIVPVKIQNRIRVPPVSIKPTQSQVCNTTVDSTCQRFIVSPSCQKFIGQLGILSQANNHLGQELNTDMTWIRSNNSRKNLSNQDSVTNTQDIPTPESVVPMPALYDIHLTRESSTDTCSSELEQIISSAKKRQQQKVDSVTPKNKNVKSQLFENNTRSPFSTDSEEIDVEGEWENPWKHTLNSCDSNDVTLVDNSHVTIQEGEVLSLRKSNEQTLQSVNLASVSSQDEIHSQLKDKYSMTPPKKRVTASMKCGDGLYFVSTKGQDEDNKKSEQITKTQKTPKKYVLEGTSPRRSPRVKTAKDKPPQLIEKAKRNLTDSKQEDFSGKFKTGNKRPREEDDILGTESRPKAKKCKTPVDLTKLNVDKFLSKLYKK